MNSCPIITKNNISKSLARIHYGLVERSTEVSYNIPIREFTYTICAWADKGHLYQKGKTHIDEYWISAQESYVTLFIYAPTVPMPLKLPKSWGTPTPAYCSSLPRLSPKIAQIVGYPHPCFLTEVIIDPAGFIPPLDCDEINRDTTKCDGDSDAAVHGATIERHADHEDTTQGEDDRDEHGNLGHKEDKH